MTLKARAYRRGKLRVPEVRLCAGPTAEAVTGSGAFLELYGTRWALLLEVSGVLRFLRLDGDAWLEVQSLEALPVLPKAARHIAFEWDGSARPVIAWELEGAVFVRRFDSFTGAYIVSSVPGLDPCLWSDALALETTTDSDVILFHLNASRTQLFSRIQRETFAVPRASSGVFALPADLDAAITEGHGVRLMLASSAGAFALQSPPYPVRLLEALTGGSSVADSVFQLTTLEHVSGDSVSGSSSVSFGELLEVTTTRLALESVSGGSSVQDGALLVVTTPHASLEALTGGSSVLNAALQLVTSNLADFNAFTGSSSVLEGSFE
jgi:hypothetical protein